MEWLKSGIRISDLFNKYKFALLIVALGIFLMVTPTTGKKENLPATSASTELKLEMDEKLVRILSQIQGVGNVHVLITEQTGTETVYQTDEDRTNGEGSGRVKRETVIVSAGGTQSGLVQTITPPTYLGAVIVCQGGGNPTVRLAVANAVSAVTGLSTDRIAVLEMK